MTRTSSSTVLALAPGWRVLGWLLCPLLGAALLWGLELAAGWVSTLAWFPFQGPFRLVESIPEPAATLGALGLGAVAGLGLALLGELDLLSLDIGASGVELRRGGKSQRFDRGAVGAVFFDGGKLVLLGTGGDELARESSDLSKARVRAAFEDHGYPWHADGDPYREDYRLWVEGTPELSDRANALLRARKVALAKDQGDEVKELRRELVKAGVFVREEKKRQYWRTSPGRQR
ncbi:YqeB family protein [Amycolatopsis magusensis]|uniref:YqeB family protein n=1 Tax=Amycolatopsis magusensis TaxID=882444 RepID=UPI003C2ECF6D